jgi:hypothetical protein
VTKLALRLVALKLAKNIFGQNVSDYLAFKPLSPFPEICAEYC